ncbi:hypothetical protein [Actinomadura hibisca]|uniref:hypothetical protein n=1 Tax=Actinomadura hibisca TaxID=68565 RepID=UPI00082D443E|nr:hypothetical protein [Actinomadura hibisca]
MAFDSALTRAVSALLCRVAASRAVRRLLVVLGLLAAGWLLGGAAQAHADGPSPADAARVVTDAPVLGDAVRVAQTATDHAHRAPRPALPVRAIADEVVKNRRPVTPTVPPVAVPAAPSARHVERAVPQAQAADKVQAPAVRKAADVSWTPRRPAKKAGPAERAHVRKAQHSKRHAAPEAADQVGNARSLAPPLPVLAEAGSVLPASGLILIGGIGAAPTRRPWALNRPRGVLLRAPGAVPPAVRTAADEPSFAPD